MAKILMNNVYKFKIKKMVENEFCTDTRRWKILFVPSALKKI
jgi:hypothetical protein